MHILDRQHYTPEGKTVFAGEAVIKDNCGVLYTLDGKLLFEIPPHKVKWDNGNPEAEVERKEYIWRGPLSNPVALSPNYLQ